jgi:hypothetical protein
MNALNRGSDTHIFIIQTVKGLFCDGLITHPEESYRVFICVWIRNLKGGGQGHIWVVEPLDGLTFVRF